MSGTWRFTGIKSQRELTFDSSDEGVRIDAPDGWVCIAPDALPRVTAAIYEAAGLPAPVILERPSAIGTALGHYAGGCRVFADGAAVRLQATESHSAKKYWHTRLKPDDARNLAAHIAAIADAVEGEPDPAEVGELTEIIAKLRTRATPPPSEELARAILRAGWKRDKQQREEARDA